MYTNDDHSMMTAITENLRKSRERIHETSLGEVTWDGPGWYAPFEVYSSSTGEWWTSWNKFGEVGDTEPDMYGTGYGSPALFHEMPD